MSFNHKVPSTDGQLHAAVQYNLEYLNSAQAAAFLHVSKSTFYKLTSKCKLPFFKPNGKLMLFKKEDLNNWINKGRVACMEVHSPAKVVRNRNKNNNIQ